MKLLILIAAIIFAILWFRYGPELSTGLSREFYQKLTATNRTTFDLRKIDSVKWDELVYWSPYTNICDYGIEGIEKGSNRCESTNDDGYSYLLFLRDNKLVGRVMLNPGKIDLSATNIKGRIPKKDAVFQFVNPSEDAKVKLVKSVSH